MTVSPLVTLLLALPVLLLGETLVRRIPGLGRTNIPAPVVGGLLVAVLVLLAHVAGLAELRLATSVDWAWWTWFVSIEPEWFARPSKSLSVPLLVGFYTCVGLNSTWDVVRKGSVLLVLFLGVATVLGVLQNLLGVAVATAIGAPPLLGVLCGSLTMTGGHGTALAFAPQFEAHGLAGAAVMASAMATMGIVIGSLMGGPLGGWLIRRHRLRAEVAAGAKAAHCGGVPAAGLWHDLTSLRRSGRVVAGQLLLVLVCVKAGAWASFLLARTGVSFPPHIGAMILGTVVRTLADLVMPGLIRSEVVGPIGSVFLAFFLTLAMMGLNLAELANAALPMLAILVAQVALMIGYAVWVTFRVMDRDYEAAQMAAGNCGFSVGNTANAIASMKALVEKYGPAPRAFLVVPLVGGMLGDFTNAVNLTCFLRWFG